MRLKPLAIYVRESQKCHRIETTDGTFILLKPFQGKDGAYLGIWKIILLLLRDRCFGKSEIRRNQYKRLTEICFETMLRVTVTNRGRPFVVTFTKKKSMFRSTQLSQKKTINQVQQSIERHSILERLDADYYFT